MKSKKKGENLHCYIKADVMAKLNEFCDITGLSKTVAVEKALSFYIDNAQTIDSKTAVLLAGYNNNNEKLQ